ncbi:MAG: hypothetical protein SCARUB_00857 [Candidatus Scalindua rubra]|uniref:DUF4062 domain-containing protein n=1 Tax=Candidatus Scalindua rubra TaxID=1872076 RepID=A0A1E3XEC7_9BACT|nr:MAG: hypothetical protein SCARUB_00857 [Candidatus Scalindua rubra]
MRKVFISSVVTDFEEFRKAAKTAVEIMGDKPIMSENFGARPYSSDIACVSEVESSDVYVLIMGSEYGYLTPERISVTHKEYCVARELGKPILAFIQDCEKEEAQIKFQKEVEDYQSGLYRAKFADPNGLKDEIIKGLRELHLMEQAAPPEIFEKRIETALKQIKGFSFFDGTELLVVWWPQPTRNIDIVSLEAKLDEKFTEMCSNKLAIMRDGYEPELKRDWTGIRSQKNTLAYFDDGLIVFILNPIIKKVGLIFSDHFASPSRIKELCLGAYEIFEGNNGWCYIGLENMDNVFVHELPESGNSISFSMDQEDSASFNRLFIPITPTVYNQWIDMCINRFKRIFSQ